jgi:DNA-binding response OmpR family regulator
VPTAGAPRVLIVEDDLSLAELYALHLRAIGLDVRVAVDGLVALEIFDTWSPALVSLDLLIPTISGFRLLGLLKKRRPDVPVIVVTALDFQEAEDIARSGADDFLTKPFDLVLLQRKVLAYLRRAAPEAVEDRSTTPHPISADSSDYGRDRRDHDSEDVIVDDDRLPSESERGWCLPLP